MKLSELVAFKKGLEELPLDSLVANTQQQLEVIMGKLGNISVYDWSELDAKRQTIVQSLGAFDLEFSKQYKSIVNEIELHEREYFELSYTIYEDQKRDTADYIFKRNKVRPINNKDDYRKRIGLYTSWKYPALYIRPGTERLVDEMIACDPLYIADHSLDLLDPVKRLWNQSFQSRIRYQLINDQSDVIFKTMPANQIGLIVATDFFDYKPLEIIKKYLLEFNNLLRPGGTVIFTYNNCDLPGPVRNVENYFNTYTPGRLLKTIVEGLGYDIIHTNNSTSGYNWFEVKKPGEIQSLRGGQALAQIKDSRLDN